MPGLDGYETCRRLKASPATRAIPVIFLTALCDTAQKLQGFEAGCVDYITKPFDHREVLARVSAHLHAAPPVRTHGRAHRAAAPGADGRPRRAGGADDEAIRRACASSTAPSTSCARRWPTRPAHRAGPPRRHQPDRLGREFQTHLGMSTFEYLREQRLVRAQELLATTDRRSSRSPMPSASSAPATSPPPSSSASASRRGSTASA
jgi:chemotaxis response regulator CheB